MNVLVFVFLTVIFTLTFINICVPTTLDKTKRKEGRVLQEHFTLIKEHMETKNV